MLFIFDFDKTLIPFSCGDFFDYDLESGTAKIFDEVDNEITVNISDFPKGSELIKVLQQLKSNPDNKLAVVSATNTDILTFVVNQIFGPDIFDEILSNERCYDEYCREKPQYRFERRPEMIWSRTYENDTYTKNPCLIALMEKYGETPETTMFFDDHEGIVIEARKILPNVIHCEDSLFTKPKILTDALNYYTLDNIWLKLVADIPDDRLAINDELVNPFPYCLNEPMLLNLANYFRDKLDIKFNNTVFIKDNSRLAKIYWTYLLRFEHVYSLGDSLDKLNFVWNKMGTEPKIKSIPFSGSMFNVMDEIVTLDEEKEANMYAKMDNLLENNPNFKELIDKIRDGIEVLITDYGNHGRAIMTLIKMFVNMGIANLSSLTYLQICPEIETIESNIAVNIPDTHGINRVYVEELPSNYFLKSEETESRCVSKYSEDMWEREPDLVWMNGLMPNYKLCNLHRVITLVILCSDIREVLGEGIEIKEENKGTYSELFLF